MQITTEGKSALSIQGNNILDLGNGLSGSNHLKSLRVISEPVCGPEYGGGKSGQFSVVWPLHRAHYLTMWEGYRVTFANWTAPQRFTGLTRHRLSDSLVGVGLPIEFVRSDREGPRTKSMRVFQVAPPDKLAAKIEAWIEKAQRFHAVPDKPAAALRAALTDVAFPLPMLGHMVYREKHKPQSTYRGSGSPKAKLTENQVKTIRQLYHTRKYRRMRRTGNTQLSYAALGKMFGVSATAIMNIVKESTWRMSTKKTGKRVYGETAADMRPDKPSEPAFHFNNKRYWNKSPFGKR